MFELLPRTDCPLTPAFKRKEKLVDKSVHAFTYNIFIHFTPHNLNGIFIILYTDWQKYPKLS